MAPVGSHFLCAVLVLLSLARHAAAHGALVLNSGGDQLYLVPADDLAAFEALEYSMLRINEMRKQCSGFRLAPLEVHNYQAVQVRLLKRPTFFEYRLHIKPRNQLAPSDLHVRIARQHSVTDLSLFQVTHVEPPPCDLYSSLDDAELLVPWHGGAALRAQRAAMHLLNEERGVLCPHRPQLQLLRSASAALQPAEGVVVRLALELREASPDFHTRAFVDKVTVAYVLDPEVPESCTISPEVYPSRSPCSLRYIEREQSAATAMGMSSGNASAAPDTSRRLQSIDFQSLGELRQRALTHGRRLQEGLAGLVSATQEDVQRRFVDKGLEIPDNFDPRMQRTICFPRGFSRTQGSCGASWAFAATAVASFRECLLHLHTGNVDAGLRFLSAQELISCAGRGGGCSGGSAALAFYHLKRHGVAREVCSPYRMRCFSDNSQIAVGAADVATSGPQSKHFKSSSVGACPRAPDPSRSPCKCLPEVYHPTRPVDCSLLPNACPKVKVPHYFSIAGTAEGSTVPQFERHLMQELMGDGPVYVSMLVWEDFYDPVSWTESGVYVHRRGALVGKHAVVAVGWGTDANSRDYWLLLNSFGNGWQQEGYFKVMRGENSLAIAKFGAWGVDWSHPHVDKSKPIIGEVEVSFSPELSAVVVTSPSASLRAVWLQVSAVTDEPARLLARVEGLTSTIVGQAKDADLLTEHVLRIDLLKLGLLDEHAKIQLWAEDEAKNTASWGPFSLEVFSRETFANSQARRLAEVWT